MLVIRHDHSDLNGMKPFALRVLQIFIILTWTKYAFNLLQRIKHQMYPGTDIIVAMETDNRSNTLADWHEYPGEEICLGFMRSFHFFLTARMLQV